MTATAVQQSFPRSISIATVEFYGNPHCCVCYTNHPTAPMLTLLTILIMTAQSFFIINFSTSIYRGEAPTAMSLHPNRHARLVTKNGNGDLTPMTSSSETVRGGAPPVERSSASLFSPHRPPTVGVVLLPSHGLRKLTFSPEDGHLVRGVSEGPRGRWLESQQVERWSWITGIIQIIQAPT